MVVFFLYDLYIFVLDKVVLRATVKPSYMPNSLMMNRLLKRFCVFVAVSMPYLSVNLFVLRFYGPVNPMGSCRARSVYLATRLLGRLSPLSRLTSIVHILSPETDNCPSWISGRERMTVENISWSISTKECCRPRRGLNPRPPVLQSDGASNWATEAGCQSIFTCVISKLWTHQLSPIACGKIVKCSLCQSCCIQNFSRQHFKTFLLFFLLLQGWTFHSNYCFWIKLECQNFLGLIFWNKCSNTCFKPFFNWNRLKLVLSGQI